MGKHTVMTKWSPFVLLADLLMHVRPSLERKLSTVPFRLDGAQMGGRLPYKETYVSFLSRYYLLYVGANVGNRGMMPNWYSSNNGSTRV